MSTPTAHELAQADQLAAASRDARKVLEGAAASGRGHLLPAVPGSWLHDQGKAMHEALTSGPVRVCAHARDGARVLHAAVWMPGVVVCPACTALLIPDHEEDHTCDRCRQPANHLHSGITAFGSVLLGYGLCHPCAASASTPTR